MINKNVLSTFAIVTFLVLSLAAVSAIQVNTLSTPGSVDEIGSSYTFSFNLFNNGSSSVNVNFTTTQSFGSVSIPSAANLAPGSNTTITGTVTGFTNRGGNTQNIGVTATSNDSSSSVLSFSVIINNVFQLCSNGTKGDVRISNFNVNNLGDGTDDEWQPLDNVEIEAEIQNKNTSESITDILVELYIYDENGNDVTDDFNVVDDQVDLGRISKKDKEIATFKIPEIPADLDEGKYSIYLKVYSDGDEENQCVSEADDFNKDTYQQVTYSREEDKSVIVRSEDLSNKVVASCGQKGSIISLPIYNLGVDKEESILVNLYNKELGIDAFDTTDNLRSGKKTEVNFQVNIPDNARADTYKLSVFTYFDYKGDKKDKMDPNSYDSNSYDDLDKDFKLPLEIVCSPKVPEISAVLASQAQIGQNLVVKTTIVNPGVPGTFSVSVSGIEEWATLVSVTPQSFDLAQGESKEVMVTVSPTVAGFHAFTIDTSVDGKSYTQPVSVTIAGKPGLFNQIDSSTLTYIMVGLVVVIILIIILILSRMSGRSHSDKF